MYDIRDDMTPDDLPDPARRRQGPQPKYPFALLEPGQHFVVPDEGEPLRVRKLLQAAAWRFKKLHPEQRFVVRHDPKAKVVRVFRVEDAHD